MWERNILRKIYDPLDIMTDIKKRQLRWVGHLERMGGERDRVHKSLRRMPDGRRKTGRPRRKTCRRWSSEMEGFG